MLISILPRQFRHNLIRHNLKLLRLSLIPILGFYISACSTLTSTSTIPATPAPVIKAPTVALVLGGGGAKGFAHVGVIKAVDGKRYQTNIGGRYECG